MTTPATKPAPNHKASALSALTALFGSGATLGGLLAFTNAHLPGVQAAIIAAVTTVATFVGRYVPYFKRAISFWRSARKQKAVQPLIDAAIEAYKASQTTAPATHVSASPAVTVTATPETPAPEATPTTPAA